MDIIDAATGETVTVWPTEKLNNEIAVWSEQKCQHGQIEIRRRVVQGGSIRFQNQCLTCGIAVGQPVKKNSVPSNTAEWDINLNVKYEAQRSKAFNAIGLRHLEFQRQGDRKYDQYLRSDAWAKKRESVLRRANGICEGCLEKRATQVHHLTYRHIYRELLFELVAVCDKCHERCHEEYDEDEEVSRLELPEEEWPEVDF